MENRETLDIVKIDDIMKSLRQGIKMRGLFQREQKFCQKCGYLKGMSKKDQCPKCGRKLTIGEKVWYIIYFHNGRRIRKAIGTSKAEAIKTLQLVKADIYRGEYRIKKKANYILFNEFAPIWLEKYSKVDNREDTYIRNKILLRTLNKYFGNKRLEDISEIDIQNFKNLRQQSRKKNGTPISNATVNRELSCLRRILNVARKKEKLIDRNVFENVEFLKEDGEGARPLQIDEEIRLLEASKKNTDYLYFLVLMARTTGMRKGEISELRWEDIILYDPPRLISTPDSSFPIEDHGKIIIKAKYAKGWRKREIPLCPILAEELRNIPVEKRKGYVFHNEKGGGLGDIRKAFETAVRNAGIGHYQFHGLRKTFATRLLQDGENLVKIQRLLGHQDIKTTIRYLGVDERELIAVMSRVGTYLRHNFSKQSASKLPLIRIEKNVQSCN